MFGFKFLKYILAVILVIGTYNYLKKEGAFTKESNTTLASIVKGFDASTQDDELVWPDLEPEKLEATLDDETKAKKILEYLLHDKLHDDEAVCRSKKAKKRTFIACEHGNIIKNNYWELSNKDQQLILLTRNETALYIAHTYTYKELVADKGPINEKLESAMRRFFEQ